MGFVGMIDLAGPQLLGHVVGQRLGPFRRLFSNPNRAAGVKPNESSPSIALTTFRYGKPMWNRRNIPRARICGPIIAPKISPSPGWRTQRRHFGFLTAPARVDSKSPSAARR